MKNPFQENLRQLAKQYHRHHPFQGERGGLATRHVYESSRQLTWWHDLEFVLNGRRVMVWWIHPRMKYDDAISDQAWREAGEPPPREDDFLVGDKIFKPAGRSRKRICGYQSPPTTDAMAAFYEKLRTIENRLCATGIDHVVVPSMNVVPTNWCTGIDLCTPLEIRCHEDAIAVAALARKLLKREITLANAFPGYQYGQREWISETGERASDLAQTQNES